MAIYELVKAAAGVLLIFTTFEFSSSVHLQFSIPFFSLLLPFVFHWGYMGEFTPRQVHLHGDSSPSVAQHSIRASSSKRMRDRQEANLYTPNMAKNGRCLVPSVPAIGKEADCNLLTYFLL